MLFRGYVDNEEATREAYVGEWLRSGDVLREDEDGNFWVTDRLKEVSFESTREPTRN
jgi:feruloyl-CoA synthase